MHLFHYFIAVLKRKVHNSQKCYRAHVNLMCLFTHLWENIRLELLKNLS